MNKRILVSGSDLYNTQMLYFTSSSLSTDNRRLYLISDRDGSPNIYVRDLSTGDERRLSDNQAGYLKSYVYFDGDIRKGLGKASVCLDGARDAVYYIQDDSICRATSEGEITVLNTIPSDQVTAFMHVSGDGKFLCVPTTDARALEFDPVTEGTGRDRRPAYNIDGRVQAEHLSSYLRMYDTQTGEMTLCERVQHCWITHVQFHPLDSSVILYNHEWPHKDCGIRRIWLFDGKRHIRVRGEGPGRSRNDWVCHEMWASDGKTIIYHGAYDGGVAFVGLYTLATGECREIALPSEYASYGHFTVALNGRLVCDGYYRHPDDFANGRESSTDGGPDPHAKNAEYICAIDVDWAAGTLKWHPLCKHESDWLDQDSHPHPIYSHDCKTIYFTSRRGATTKVYCVAAE